MADTDSFLREVQRKQRVSAHVQTEDLVEIGSRSSFFVHIFPFRLLKVSSTIKKANLIVLKLILLKILLVDRLKFRFLRRQ